MCPKKNRLCGGAAAFFFGQREQMASSVHRAPHWLEITLDRAEHSNAINREMEEALLRIFDDVCADKRITLVTLRGRGRYFSSGAEQADAAALATTAEANAASAARFSEVLYRLRRLPACVVAVVHGSALGGGVGIACACDYVYCKRGACFQLPEIGLGLAPAIVCPFVARRVGERVFSQMALDARVLTSKDALLAGLVDAVYADESELEQLLSAKGTAFGRRQRDVVWANKRLGVELEAGRERYDAWARDHLVALRAGRVSEPAEKSAA